MRHTQTLSLTITHIHTCNRQESSKNSNTASSNSTHALSPKIENTKPYTRQLWYILLLFITIPQTWSLQGVISLPGCQQGRAMLVEGRGPKRAKVCGNNQEGRMGQERRSSFSVGEGMWAREGERERERERERESQPIGILVVLDKSHQAQPPLHCKWMLWRSPKFISTGYKNSRDETISQMKAGGKNFIPSKKKFSYGWNFFIMQILSVLTTIQSLWHSLRHGWNSILLNIIYYFTAIWG